MHWARGKYKTLISGAIIGFIAFVFIASDMIRPKATRGLHEGAVAGTVNGDPISLTDFNRALNQRMEFFKNLGGGKISEEQLKQFRVRDGVFQELVRRKLMVQEADRQGMDAADDEVRERIREIPAFQKDGKFDVTTYKSVLAANNHNPASFENLVREDISVQAWQRYFQERVKVSAAEIQQQFLISQDKRDIKYILLPVPASKPGDKPEVFEAARKANEKLADQVLALMTADKGSDAKVNALLKAGKVTVKNTGMVSRQSSFLPGIGEATELMKDAFSAQAGKVKKYMIPSGVLVAVVTDSQKADLAKLETERMALFKQISMRKQRELSDEWMKRVMAKAKIDPNPTVVGQES